MSQKRSFQKCFLEETDPQPDGSLSKRNASNLSFRPYLSVPKGELRTRDGYSPLGASLAMMSVQNDEGTDLFSSSSAEIYHC